MSVPKTIELSPELVEIINTPVKEFVKAGKAVTVNEFITFTYNDKPRRGKIKVVGTTKLADNRSKPYIVLEEAGRTRNYNIAKMSDIRTLS